MQVQRRTLFPLRAPPGTIVGTRAVGSSPTWQYQPEAGPARSDPGIWDTGNLRQGAHAPSPGPSSWPAPESEGPALTLHSNNTTCSHFLLQISLQCPPHPEGCGTILGRPGHKERDPHTLPSWSFLLIRQGRQAGYERPSVSHAPPPCPKKTKEGNHPPSRAPGTGPLLRGLSLDSPKNPAWLTPYLHLTGLQ